MQRAALQAKLLALEAVVSNMTFEIEKVQGEKEIMKGIIQQKGEDIEAFKKEQDHLYQQVKIPLSLSKLD